MIKQPFAFSIKAQRYSEIEPTGGDVDYFRFTANGGQSLIAEVIGGTLDSVIGVFDEYGNLIAIDDDGGVGLLSKVVVEMPVTSEYILAVSTFPDYDFNGVQPVGSRHDLRAFYVRRRL